MIYIVTAMYAEARPFIESFGLKKDISQTRFQVFRSREAEICLLISGSGPIAAAVAVSSVLAQSRTGREDFLVNAGICACIQGSFRQGDIFLCSKIRERASGRTFYPDLLYRHEFREAQIITGAKPCDGTDGKEPAEEGFCLYDMEAAAVYQAGAYYLGPHQMSFLKVVSDDGNVRHLTPDLIGRLMEENREGIADYIKVLQAAACGQRREAIFTEETEALIERLCADLHCSRVMSESLRQHMRYFVLSGADFESVTEEMYREGRLPCKDKREGKKCLEEFGKRLL